MRALLRSRTSRGTVPSNWPASEQKGTSVTSFCIWRLGTVALIARFVQIRFKPELVAPGQVLSWYFFGTSKWIVSFLAVIQRSIHRTYQHGSLAVSLFSCRLEGPLGHSSFLIWGTVLSAGDPHRPLGRRRCDLRRPLWAPCPGERILQRTFERFWSCRNSLTACSSQC